MRRLDPARFLDAARCCLVCSTSPAGPVLSTAMRLRTSDRLRESSDHAMKTTNRKKQDEFVSSIGTSRPLQLGKPGEHKGGFFRSLFGKNSRTQPMNPLQVLKQNSAPDKTSQELMRALRKMGGGGKPQNITVTEEQQLDMVSAHLRSKWYGPSVKKALDVLPPSKVQHGMKVCRLASALLLVFLMALAAIVHIYEMYMFGLLDDADRETYAHCITYMRKNDLVHIGEAVEAREDPSGLLPFTALVALIMKELRGQGYHTKDFETEYRGRPTIWEELDYLTVVIDVFRWVGAIAFFETPGVFEVTSDRWIGWGEATRDEMRKTMIGPLDGAESDAATPTSAATTPGKGK